MSKQAARTMRIDLAAVAAPGPRRATRRSDTVTTTAFSAKRHDRLDRDTPYDLLLESVYDAVLITNRYGRVIDFNGRAADFFLADEDRLLGLPVWNLLSGAGEALVDTIHSNLLSHKYTLIEAICLRTDGTSFTAEIAVNSLNLDEEGHQLCFFVRNITERKRDQEALEKAVERLQAHDRARMEFVSNVSHELRTPLTSMIYAVNNMLRGVVGPLPERAVMYLERLGSDCKRLLTTVNDILDLRQVETKTLTLTLARAPCTTLIQAGVETLRVQADAKHIRMRVDMPPAELFCTCDAQKIERVMINVVGNAVKFCGDDGGQITVSLARDPADSGFALITVSDTGVGIPPDALARVTQRYFRVGDHVTGSGLGLAISREIVELHGGSLHVASPVPGSDCGTAVTIRLPLAAAPAVAIFCMTADVALMLEGQLANRGYRVHSARSLDDALRLCATQAADMLVFECCCGQDPNSETLLKLRNDPQTQRTPVLVMSRDEISKPCREMLRRLAIPVLPVPWNEADLAGRVLWAFSGRTLISLGGSIPTSGG
ncbi:MAG: HAMP domain-containing histidine kinase [Lentisphaerae bacterium]|nr:HAMP domain-containing histidine kinase [Lentisphaerota bacterium]